MRATITHATGNRNVRHAIAAFRSASMLARFYTTVGLTSESPLMRFAPINHLFGKRSYAVARNELRTRPSRELARQLAGATGMGHLVVPNGLLGFERVAQDMDRWAAREMQRDIDVAYLYLDQAEAQLASARDKDIATILECHHALASSASHWIRSEMEANPGWAASINAGALRESQQVSQHRQVQLATSIVVPSRQVAESVTRAGFAGTVKLIPYGCPAVPEGAAPRVGPRRERPLRVLFVGRVSAMKGLAHLERALRLVDVPVELVVAGPAPSITTKTVDRFLSSVTYLGVLDRAKVGQAMSEADVFVMPSLIEGRSLAVLEALSVGAPCIVTPGSGTDDLVERGAGIVVPNADANALAAAFRTLFDAPGMVEEMSAAALAVARESNWGRFERGVLDEAIRTVTEKDLGRADG